MNFKRCSTTVNQWKISTTREKTSSASLPRSFFDCPQTDDMREFLRARYMDRNGSKAVEQTQITVNIGGVKYILHEDELKRYPETRLAELMNRATDSPHEDLSTLCDDYDDINREFYFDRDTDVFKCIRELYYYGEIHIKCGICPMWFIKEMEYWGIDEKYLDECCSSRLNEIKNELVEVAERVKTILEELDYEETVSGAQRWQTILWKLMEKPESSLPARMITVISILFVLLSSVVMCVGTIPELQVHDAEGNLVDHPTLESIETVCIIFFTVEYALRFVSSSDKFRFVFTLENIIDFLVIMPYYLVQILTHMGTEMMELASVHQAVQTFHIMRIARILKIARHSTGLQTLFLSLKSSLSELGLLFIYMTVGTFYFAALGYTIEQSHKEPMLTSIPLSLWWAVITMTTVGYGDVYPKTFMGRCNAVFSSLCGIVFISLPIRLIMNNFVLIYNKQSVLEIAARHEIELMALRKEESEDHPVAEEVHSTVKNLVRDKREKHMSRVTTDKTRSVSKKGRSSNARTTRL